MSPWGSEPGRSGLLVVFSPSPPSEASSPSKLPQRTVCLGQGLLWPESPSASLPTSRGGLAPLLSGIASVVTCRFGGVRVYLSLPHLHSFRVRILGSVYTRRTPDRKVRCEFAQGLTMSSFTQPSPGGQSLSVTQLEQVLRWLQQNFTI